MNTNNPANNSGSIGTASLSELLRDHTINQSEQRRKTEQLRREAVKDIGELCDVTVDEIGQKLNKVLLQQKEIETLARDSAQAVQKHVRSTQKWAKLVDQFNSALKELGDVSNWASVIERDMLDVAATLEIVHKSLNP